MKSKFMGEGEARQLASQIVGGEQPALWSALCDVYEVTEETCTIAELIRLLQQTEVEYLNPLIR